MRCPNDIKPRPSVAVRRRLVARGPVGARGRVRDHWSRLYGVALVVLVQGGVAFAADGAAEPDWAAMRRDAADHAAAYAALRHGLGPAAERERQRREAEAQQPATMQPHYAHTHPWVQRPVAQAGWYVPPVHPDIFPRPLVVDRRPIVIVPRRPFPPRRYFRGPPPPRFAPPPRWTPPLRPPPRPPRRW